MAGILVCLSWESSAFLGPVTCDGSSDVIKTEVKGGTYDLIVSFLLS